MVRRQVLGLAWQSAVIVALAILLGIASNHMRSNKLPWIAHWPQEDRSTDHSEDDMTVSLDEAEVLYFSGLAVFLDARSPEAYELGHIQGAYNLPWQDFDERVGAVMAKIPHDATIVTYCDGTGCSLSRELAFALLEKGYGNVRVLVNGWTLWQQYDLPAAVGGRKESQ